MQLNPSFKTLYKFELFGRLSARCPNSLKLRVASEGAHKNRVKCSTVDGKPILQLAEKARKNAGLPLGVCSANGNLKALGTQVKGIPLGTQSLQRL